MATGALSLVFLIFFAAISSAQICLPTAPGSASNVVGQTDFSGMGGGSTDSQLTAPHSVYVHPTSQKVFVGDYTNRRIQRFNSSAALLNGSAAEITAFGISGNATATQETLVGVYQITMYDTTLFAADGDGCRVLRIDGVTTANATVTLATNVYGQSLFNTTVCSGNTTSDLMFHKVWQSPTTKPFGSPIVRILWLRDLTTFLHLVIILLPTPILESTVPVISPKILFNH